MAEAPQENAAPSTPDPQTTEANSPEAAKGKAGEIGEAATPPKAAKVKAGETGEAAAKPKKEKAPALEDKPFTEFMEQDCLPALQQSLVKQGVQGVELTFIKQTVPVRGFSQASDCWQLVGKWLTNKQYREFNIYFFEESLQGPRGFSFTESRGKPSTLEPFMIDERKITLDLLVACTLQRLNGQKWLARN